jgi:hypothetical protein
MLTDQLQEIIASNSFPARVYPFDPMFAFHASGKCPIPIHHSIALLVPWCAGPALHPLSS